MLLATLLIIHQIFQLAYCKLYFQELQTTHVSLCLGKLISSLKKGSKVAYVDNGYEDVDVIKVLNKMNHVTVVSRTINSKLNFEHEVYVISSAEGNVTRLLETLKHEVGWRRDAKFILVSSIYTNPANEIFNALLRYHITDVIIVNGTVDPELLTYSPFENNTCGKRFDRISQVKCFEANSIFPLKFHPIGLRNCNFRALVTNSPPFTSTEDKQIREIGKLGVEQFVMDTLAELEQFEITYITYDNTEELSVIEKNLSVHGPMRLVQEQKVDIIMGAMLLLSQRAKAFDYLWSHITFTDEFKIVVKKADVVPHWKNIYLEFDCTVWTLIFVTYFIYVKLVLLFLRQRKTGVVALMMMDYIFLHGSKLGNISRTRWILLIWIIFTYLISTYYQSSLTSLLAHPNMMYQIASESDLVKFDVKPYFSQFYNGFIDQITEEHTNKSVTVECGIQLECLKRVSESYSVYTIVLHSLYLQSNWRFRDTRDNSLLYPFSQPLGKIIYAVYFDKGFPLLDKFHLHMLHMKESGLVDKYLDEFYRKYNRDSSVPPNVYSHVIFSWHILAIGYNLSAVCFILEIVVNKIKK